MPLFGIEVSKYNGNINYAAAKNAGVRFAIVSASSEERADSRFEANVNGFYAAGVPIAACYTLSASSVHEAFCEANRFIGFIANYRDKLTLPPVCKVNADTVSPHLSNIFIKQLKSARFDACILSDGTDAFCDNELAAHIYTRQGQLVGVVGEFACAFGYAPISRRIITSHTDITDDILDYIATNERGEYILARLADMIVARSIKPLVNASYERIVPLLRLSCALTHEDMQYLCAHRYSEEIIHELYLAMVR